VQVPHAPGSSIGDLAGPADTGCILRECDDNPAPQTLALPPRRCKGGHHKRFCSAGRNKSCASVPESRALIIESHQVEDVDARSCRPTRRFNYLQVSPSAPLHARGVQAAQPTRCSPRSLLQHQSTPDPQATYILPRPRIARFSLLGHEWKV
jgi:hypothetical protein